MSPNGLTSAPTITGQASNDRVRITGPASTAQMRLEIYDHNETKVWDREIRGNVFDWHIQNGAAERLSNGEYACVGNLVVAGTEVLNCSAETLEEEFARYFLKDAPNRWPAWFSMSKSAREFL